MLACTFQVYFINYVYYLLSSPVKWLITLLVSLKIKWTMLITIKIAIISNGNMINKIIGITIKINFQNIFIILLRYFNKIS
jgi:hypothetical protein